MVEPAQKLTAIRTLERIASLSWNSTYIEDDIYLPRSVIKISSTLLKKFICVEGCTACCMQGPLTLDFIPDEPAWKNLPLKYKILFDTKMVTVNGITKPIFSMVKPRGECAMLGEVRHGQLGCDIWQTGNPIECDASARIQIQNFDHTGTIVLKRIFSRAWRYDPPVQCEYHEIDHEELYGELTKDIMVMSRYWDWSRYFGITDTAISWIIKQLEYAKIYGKFGEEETKS